MATIVYDMFNKTLDKKTFIDGVTRLVKKLNSFESRKDCTEFILDGKVVGLINPKFLLALRAYPDVFFIEGKKVRLNQSLKSFEERTSIIEEILIDLRNKNLFSELNGWRNEHYYVRSSFSQEPKFSIERSAASLFGIRCYGCHINGYVKKDNQYFMWIARRSKTKQTYPSMLDNFVAGGLTAGLGVFECAKKELEEEAGVNIETSSKLKAVDAISYAYEKENGVSMEGEFVFDIKLPIDFKPINQDGEVDCFYFMNINQVKNAIISDEFKPNSAAVTLNFLMRKGLLTPDELSNYYEILENIHAPGL